MDSLNFYNIRAEKENAILKNRQLQKIANLFRLIEVCVVLVVISRFSSYLPNTVKNSGEYFRNLSAILIDPRFVFLIGNAIVVTLFAKSRQFSAKDPARKNPIANLYDEFIQNSNKNQKSEHAEIEEHRSKQIDIAEEVCDSREIKNYRRSQSEKMKNNKHRELRRSETEKCKKIVRWSDGAAKSLCPEETMSNEEFRRTVEDFIARQQRLLRDEDYCVF